jgi:hypothetical protein
MAMFMGFSRGFSRGFSMGFSTGFSYGIFLWDLAINARDVFRGGAQSSQSSPFTVVWSMAHFD